MMGGARRGCIAYSSARPPVPFDIFACPVPPPSPWSDSDELHLTDSISHNYNCRQIPPGALKALIKRPKLVADVGATEADVDDGRVSGFVFVSERDDGLETLYVALHILGGSGGGGGVNDRVVKVFSMAELFGPGDFSGARLEDSGCFGGGYTVGSRTVDHCIIYASTKEPAKERRSPWTAVYKTNLRTGKTERLTPQGVSDLSPAVSPSGRLVAVASFQWSKWQGLGAADVLIKTDIYVMSVDSEGEELMRRKLVITDGGWPSWGSDDVIFFHQQAPFEANPRTCLWLTNWGVFRYRITTNEMIRVTPDTFDGMTPAAMGENKVAVATIRQRSLQSYQYTEYRHIEIFDLDEAHPPLQITRAIRPCADHYSPFLLDGGSRIGYHRHRNQYDEDDGASLLQRSFGKQQPPDSHEEEVDLIRMFGLFPTVSKDGSKLAFVDRERKSVWLADSDGGLRFIYEKSHHHNHFVCAISWNQNQNKDTLYVCVQQPSSSFRRAVQIYAILNASKPRTQRLVQRLTTGGLNNSFPSSSPDGNKLVFCSTRYHVDDRHSNLYIMEDAEIGEFGDEGQVTRLTFGQHDDSHCQWSPNGDWIVFVSSRNRWQSFELGYGTPDEDAYYAVFLVKATDPAVVVRVINSGHVLHPGFSADGRSIVVSADLAAVSVKPISLPPIRAEWHPYGAIFPYSDIFVVDIDNTDLETNKDVEGFHVHRITHSRYDCSTSAWAAFATDDQRALWNILLKPTQRRLPSQFSRG